MRSCAHWLVANCGITLGVAREKVRVARQLVGLPEIDEAFSEGGLSYSKVRAITRVATPDNEGFMLHLAHQHSAGHLERLVSRYEPVPEPGQLVMKALQAVARPLEEERKEEWQAKQKARMQEVARRILQRNRSNSEAKPETRTDDGQTAAADAVPDHLAYARAEEKISAATFSQHMNQLRADALVAMVEHFLATGPDYRGLQGLKGSERCQVVLHVDVNTLREQRSGVCCTHGRGHFEDKPWLAPSTARRLSCDASLVTVLEDDAGKVLNVGRKSRIVPGPIRRALRERDGVCQYPGCQESEYVDAHHIQHWAEGGETRLDNLVTLCRFHHRQLHRGCFDIRLNGVSAEILAPGEEVMNHR